MKNFILKNTRPPTGINLFLFFLVSFAFTSCAILPPDKSKELLISPNINYRERGIASWYGKKFHGRLTANGEVYNMYGISAAHKTLPLGSVCRVTNIRNGNSIVLRINDRGPFIGERIIDLSYGAAKKLGYENEGLAEVLIETDVKMKDWGNDYSIQAGSFIEMENAERLKNSISEKYKNTYIEKYKNGRKTFYRVKIGHFKNIADAQEILTDLNASGVSAFVVSNN